MKKHLLTVGIVILLLAVGLSGCLDTDTEYTSGLPSVDDVEILQHSMNYHLVGYVVNGTAKNIGDEQVSVAIKAKFYDENDVLIDTSLDYMSDVDPGEVFVFEIYCFEEEIIIDHYTIAIDSVI